MCDVLRLVLVCGLAPFVKGAALRPPSTVHYKQPATPSTIFHFSRLLK
jgi:hypothetical protein